jgi:hypothetical protein
MNNSGIASPQAIIYSTRADYSVNVPVMLTPDKKEIASYPDIRDVVVGSKLTLPTRLHKGFWLDNRGISTDVAFIRLTYEEYAALPKTPTADELMKIILDKDPVVEMYACGPRGKFTDITEELNQAIDQGKLSGFKRLK